jgi:COMPASS component SWD3
MAIQLDTAGDASSSTGLFTPSATLNAHSRAVTALRFSHDGSTLLSAGADGFVHFWCAKTGAHQRSLRCHRTGEKYHVCSFSF